MAVIAFVNQKGGCGKSTASCHLAYWLMKRKHNVALVDADAQQSVSRWLKAMDIPVSSYVMGNPDQVMDELPKLKPNYDYIIVDGAGGLSEVTRCIILWSDLVIIPVQPSGLDLTSANDAIKLVKQAQLVRNGAPQVCTLLSRAVKRTRLRKEAIEYLSDKSMLKTVIHQHQAIADCFGQGAVVWTLPGSDSSMAANEYEALCKEIKRVAG